MQCLQNISDQMTPYMFCRFPKCPSARNVQFLGKRKEAQMDTVGFNPFRSEPKGNESGAANRRPRCLDSKCRSGFRFHHNRKRVSEQLQGVYKVSLQRLPTQLRDVMDKDYVGFATLPSQVHRKSVKKGFDFTLMVAGESGLGKSTLVDSLFLTDLYKDRVFPDVEARIPKTLEIVKHAVDIEEKGVRVKLTVIDTPGFGDAVNNTECWKPIVHYIDSQFEQYFRDESGLDRKNIQDGRVHCCLYVLSPFGHGLRPLDVAFLRAIHEKVNIVPVIGKADSLTPAEVQYKKQKIRQELAENGIHIYEFPDCDSDEDEEFKAQDAEMKRSIPFAVIGSSQVVRELKDKVFRGRLYPWGTVEVENSAHCDFLKLRNMLIQTHMQDLKDVTQEVHYENYRAQCIQSLTRTGARDRSSRAKLSRQSATELPLLPLAETEKLIREKDEELRRMQEMLQKMQAQMLQNQGDQCDSL